MKIWQKRVLGILAIGGGSVGVTAGAMALAQAQSIFGMFLVLVFVAVYAWGIWCGLMIFEAAPGAISQNRIFWAAQIPILASPILTYSFFCAAEAQIYLRLDSIGGGVYWHIGSLFNFALFKPDKPPMVGINIFALLMFIFLTKLQQATNERDPADAAQPL